MTCANISRDGRSDLVRSLDAKRPTLLFVQTKYLDELLAELPVEMEFVAKTRGEAVTVGEVRHRARHAGRWRSTSADYLDGINRINRMEGQKPEFAGFCPSILLSC